jgi:hypothetical protein
MTHHTSRLLAALCFTFAALALLPHAASAQSLDPRTYLKPNVMILLDTSGSMMWPADIQSKYPWVSTFANSGTTYTCNGPIRTNCPQLLHVHFSQW